MSAPITVVGSLNMDFVVQVRRLPRPGETVAGSRFATIPGGKGADLADAIAFANVAAALSVRRLGAQASVPPRDEVEAAQAR